MGTVLLGGMKRADIAAPPRRDTVVVRHELPRSDAADTVPDDDDECLEEVAAPGENP